MENLTAIIESIDAWVWQPMLMPFVLLIVGAWLTVRTGFVQLRHFPTAVKFSLRGAFGGGRTAAGTITPFQALSTALAATVGNGNIGGVATAILIGGPGAVFWMWVCATAGMATKFAEAVLGVHFRVRRESGELASGPMYYIEHSLPTRQAGRRLAMAFAFFGMCAALLGTGNMAQSNTSARTFVAAYGLVFGEQLPLWIPGLLITTAVGMVLLGGIKRIASTAERIVPFMIVVYMLAAVAYLLLNLSHIPHVFALIFGDAFTPSAPVGGFAGASLAKAIQIGVSRGVLSNEAGLGSSPIAHGIANVKHPVEQGTVGVFEVFLDTIVVCSLTAFIILSSGLWTEARFQGASGDLTAAALGTSIPGAAVIVAVSSFLFGFSTLLGWCYYGEKCFEYLFGSKRIMAYRAVFTALIMVGSMISVPMVWAVGTLLNGFMALPNLIGLAFLSGTVAKLTKDYFSGAHKYAVHQAHTVKD
jgi:alanine or glycine:cation symporter, AGCS family